MANGEAALPGVSDEVLDRVRSVLAAKSRGLFTDVDGTISAIAPTPEQAVLLPGVAELLRRARDVFGVVAAVSGRSAQDTARMVGVPGLTYIGNHGFERVEPEGERVVLPEALQYEPAVAAVMTQVGKRLAQRFPGLRLEPKGATASIHVRGTADPAAAEEAAYQTATELAEPRGLRVTRGKLVVELRPPVNMDKGAAVEDVIRRHGLRGAIYLGDDRTDLDAFRALRRLEAAGVCRGVAVAVLHAEAPAELADEADLTLASVEQVPAFLRWLLANA
ncbi:MAG TPA: trehalose-phosphatase [Ktedonobacterales bacterium]|nr:trehalose-phosphatase [Ktedonobacterales bacterium]